MPAYSRSEIVAADEVGFYHCIARCVRRAFLCGADPLTGKNHDHRKEWIRERLQKLASVFAVEVCAYAVMSNHLHTILRIRPDLARNWTDEEVALRWWLLSAPCDDASGQPAEPEQADLDVITSAPEWVAELRGRLASLSWFMRCLNEPIARAANREDQCTGRFWEGRFRSVAMLDEAAVLACSVYVDLNPVRAGIVCTPEESKHTSAFDRIRSLQAARMDSALDQATSIDACLVERALDDASTPRSQRPDGWLCEFTLDEQTVGMLASPPVLGRSVAESPFDRAALPGRTGREARIRASNRGYLAMTLEKYLSLLDWTGRELRAVREGTIPVPLSPILERLGLKCECWLETVRHFGRWFKRAAGAKASLAAHAARCGRRWFQGQRAALIAFQ